MKSFIIILVSLLVSGLEPFWPLGSPVIAVSAVLGTKYPNSRGIITVILIGLARDVLLVNRLGVSSLIAVFAWFIAALGATRLGRPVVVSLAAAGVVGLPAAFSPGPFSYQYILATLVLAGVFAAVWNYVSERDEKIRVK